MRTVNEEARRHRQIEIMETAFNCYAENGFCTVGIKEIAKACGCSATALYLYFDNLDDLIVKSTEYCMSKVEDDFMAKAPTDVEDLWRFIDEIPRLDGKKARQEIPPDVSDLHPPEIQGVRSEVLSGCR